MSDCIHSQSLSLFSPSPIISFSVVLFLSLSIFLSLTFSLSLFSHFGRKLQHTNTNVRSFSAKRGGEGLVDIVMRARCVCGLAYPCWQSCQNIVEKSFVVFIICLLLERILSVRMREERERMSDLVSMKCCLPWFCTVRKNTENYTPSLSRMHSSAFFPALQPPVGRRDGKKGKKDLEEIGNICEVCERMREKVRKKREWERVSVWVNEWDREKDRKRERERSAHNTYFHVLLCFFKNKFSCEGIHGGS